MTDYTQVDKIKECLKIRTQLKELGLEQVYVKEIEKFDNIVQNFVKNDEEYTGDIRFRGANRILRIRFRNRKKWPISAVLIFDENV